MKTLWHIFKKDFTHLRLALVLWVLLVGCEIVFNQLLFSPAGIDAEWFERTRLYAGLLSFITLAVAYLLIAGLVLEDPTVGTQMFWATRPISGGRLLGAKLLGVVLLFGALPMLVRLPWWLYCGYSWPEVGTAVLQNLALLGLLAIPAMVLAALSGQSNRFVLFSLLLLVAIPIASALFFARTGPVHSTALIQQRLPLSLLVFALGGIVAAVWQFITRRLLQATAILTAGAGLAAAGLFFSPWRLDRFWPEDKAQLAGTEAISAEILDTQIVRSKNGSAAENTQVSLTLALKNIPASEVLLSGVADIELRWPDGLVVSQPHRGLWPIMNIEPDALRRILALSPVPLDPETAKKWGELRKEHPPSPPRPAPHKNNRPSHTFAANEAGFGCTLVVTPAVAAHIKAEPPACSISARFVVGRPEVLFEMPMQAGARHSGQGVRLQVLALAPFHPREGQIDPLLNKLTLTVVSAAAPWLTPSIYRVDRERGVLEHIVGNTSSLSVQPAQTKIERIAYPLSIWRVWRTNQWVDLPDWLSAQTLAVVTYRKVGGFNRDLHLDRLPLQNDAAE